jgi:light-regulated signal transduction histidine kinase (bacteriophytochrome)
MGELIDALLSLTRVSRSSIRLERVDLSAMARRVADELLEATPDRAMQVSIAEGLSAKTDEPLIEVVLRNLLGNAWKFTAGKEMAHVEVGRAVSDGREAFFVRDDGVGFDPAYADKLFLPFQRLHAADEFPGTGIGLATVARVLGRLGGSWWAEGGVGAGAVFFFTLNDGTRTEAR